jgi:hypothetical protein
MMIPQVLIIRRDGLRLFVTLAAVAPVFYSALVA